MSLALIASYPKSGNTWMRVFLESYCSQDGESDINSRDTPICADRSLFQEFAGISSTDLSDEEVYLLRAAVYRGMAAQGEEQRFLKVHDLPIALGKPLFPSGMKAIYVVRNPLDVLVSAADFFSFRTLDEAVVLLGDLGAGLAKREKGLHAQLPQHLGSWSRHVSEWLFGVHELQIFLCRYEDMYAAPAKVFSEVIEFLGLSLDDEKLERAIESSQFCNLTRSEREEGYQGRSPKQERFFRRGRPGAGLALPSEVRNRITSEHGDMMRRLGYHSV